MKAQRGSSPGCFGRSPSVHRWWGGPSSGARLPGIPGLSRAAAPRRVLVLESGRGEAEGGQTLREPPRAGNDLAVATLSGRSGRGEKVA